MLSRTQTCLCSALNTVRAWILGLLVGGGYVCINARGILIVWLGFLIILGTRDTLTPRDVFFFFCGYFQVSLYWVCLCLTWFEACWWEYLLPLLGPGIIGGAMALGIGILIPWWRVCDGIRFYAFGVWWSVVNVFFSLCELPWVSVSDLWVSFALPVVQIACVIGKDCLDLVLLASMLMVVHGVWKKHLRVGLSGLCVLSVLYAWGGWRLSEAKHESSHAYSVRLVHTQIGLHSRAPESLEPQAYTLMHIAHSGEDDRVVATVLPEAFFVAPLTHYPQCMDVLHTHQKHHILAGAIMRENDTMFNSVLLLDATRGDHAIYHKRFLVPFGEYVPFADYISWGVQAIAQGGVDFSRGTKPSLYVCSDLCGCRLPPFWVMVCYEGVHAKYQFETKALWLMQVSNECWFYDSCAREQHWCMLRMRAIEVGRPILRATNWGVSGCIDGYGRERLRYSGKARVLKQVIPPVAEDVTVWVRLQEFWRAVYWIVVALCSASLWVYIKRRKSVLGKKENS